MSQDFLPEMLAAIVRWLFVQAPLLLVWIGGIIFAIARWRRHPMVCLWTVVALVVLLLTTVGGVCVSALIPRVLIENDSVSNIEVVMSAFWFFISAIRAVAWGVILMALFGWRNPAPLAPGFPAQRGPWEAGR